MSDESVADHAAAEESSAGRNERGRWLPGTSGNPKGAPPATPERRSVKELAQDKTEEAFHELCELMKHPKTTQRTKLACIREVFNRGWGKPTEMQVIASERLPSRFDSYGDIELARDIAFILGSAIQQQERREPRTSISHVPLEVEQ